MLENITQEPIVETKMEKFAKLLLKVTVAVSVISILIGLIAMGVGSQSLMNYLILGTYLTTAAVSVVFSVIFLIVGTITYKKGGGRLMRFAGLFFITTLVVGTGTCFVNISAVDILCPSC